MKKTQFRYYKILEGQNRKLFLDNKTEEKMNDWLDYLKQDETDSILKENVVIPVYSKDGDTAEDFSAYVSQQFSRQLIVVEFDWLSYLFENKENALDIIQSKIKEHQSYLAIKINSEDIKPSKLNNELKVLLYELKTISPIIFLVSSEDVHIQDDINDSLLIEFHLDILKNDIRRIIWEETLSDDFNYINERTLNILIRQYNLYEGQIRRAVDLARNNCLPYGESKAQSL